jgi:hypothetical protein
MKTKLSFILVLLCAVAQGAWAQTNVTTKEQLTAAITNGANIVLGADINLSDELTIDGNKSVTIDLNGHKLDRGLGTASSMGSGVIYIKSGSSLTINDGSGDNSGKITGGYANKGGAISNLGTLVFNGGTITGNRAGDEGGGIFNMGTATITGGVISGNTASGSGGGISNSGTMTINDCSITGNTSSRAGGGISNGNTLTINGGSITGNSATEYGGGIWMGSYNTFSMQGAITVTGNTKAGGLPDNVYLAKNKVITVTGSLSGSNIGISMETAGTFTSGYNTYNSGVDPATLFTPDLSGVMAISLDGNEAKLASILPEGTVYYIERSWDEENKVVKAEVRYLKAGQYQVLNQDNYDQASPTKIQPGYYVINNNVQINNLCTEGNGEHHLILCDGATLTMMHINVEGQNSLHIYGQAKGTGAIQQYQYLMIGYCAGIGGGDEKSNGPIYIHGGNLNVGGNAYAAGIGGGKKASAGIVTIYGGHIIAEGSDSGDQSTPGGAGIGGGACYHSSKGGGGGTITIYGGHVEAYGGNSGGAGIGGGDEGNGGDITIHGGYVKAVGNNFGSGIGSGDNFRGNVTTSGTLLVTGGEVYARGVGRAAGIGGGRDVNGATVTVTGGYVYAQGGEYAAGIGSGMEEVTSGGVHGGKLTVTGGQVYAYGGEDAAGIGGGEDADGGTVTISGGFVYAEGNYWGAGIGGGEKGDGAKVTITGGTVIAKAGRDESGCHAIGPGEGCDENGSLTLGDDRCVYITSNLWRCQKANRVSDCWAAMIVQISKCLHGDATASVVNGDKHDIGNCKWCYTTGEEAHAFGDYGECTACGLISLSDNTGNTGTISHWAKESTAKSVVLTGRTLWKDDGWNTLCLPFDVTLAGSPLAGATMQELSYVDFASGTLTLTFTDATSIKAGKPYLIKWASGSNLTNPVFTGVTLNASTNAKACSISDEASITFAGTYEKLTFYADDPSILLVGDENSLYYPKAGAFLGAQRAYFTLNGITAGDLPKGIKSMVLNFEDEEAMSIEELKDGKVEELKLDDVWYTLQGVQLDSKPTERGIYIHNGRKEAVR